MRGCMVTLFGIGECDRGGKLAGGRKERRNCFLGTGNGLGCVAEYFRARNGDGQRMVSVEPCDFKHLCSQGTINCVQLGFALSVLKNPTLSYT